MNVSLTPELEQLVEETVSTGRYSSASEVVRASLRSFLDEERWKTYARAKIEKGLEDAAAGRIVEGDEAMRRIRSAARRKK
jgi:antitoxin ParD1/3/4